MLETKQGRVVTTDWTVAEIIERAVRDWQGGTGWHVGLDVIQRLKDAGYAVVTRETGSEAGFGSDRPDYPQLILLRAIRDSYRA